MRLVGERGFYLIHHDALGAEMADTYHATVGEAMAQARFEFGIERSEWQAPPAASTAE